MGQKNKVNAISDGIDFERVPTSDRPAVTPDTRFSSPTSDLPVVVAARKLKQQKRIKILKYCFYVLFVVTTVAVLGTLLTSETKEPDLEKMSAPADGRTGKELHTAPTRRQDDQPSGNRRQDDEPAGGSGALFGLPETLDLKSLGKASAAIGMKLYSEEIKNSVGNLLFSPFSIQSALSMVSMGAKGSSLDQLMTFFSPAKKSGGDLFSSVEDVSALFGAALPSFKSTPNLTIQTANSIFVNKEYDILDAMVLGLDKYYQTQFMEADYTKPETAASLINNWVEEKTMEKIKDLVSPASLGENTKMVLVNALYFKGLWENQFAEEETRKQTFHVSEKEEVEADFMHQKKKLHVGRYKDRTLIGLPYSGGRFAMYLFVPHNVRDFNDRGGFFEEPEAESGSEEPLSTLEDLLVEDPEGLFEALQLETMRKVEVDLLLPRFKIESTVPLKQDLQRLGVTAPFSAMEADLSGISGSRDLFISDAIHKAFLEVDEEGSEGAAATAVVASNRSMPPPPLPAHLDRPFVFFIKDQETGLVLFQGRVVNPNQ